MKPAPTWDIVIALSPLHVIGLQERCKQEVQKRRGDISRILSLQFVALDPDFIRVTISEHDNRDSRLTRITYFIKHPRQELDPAKYYPMTVSSGASGVDGKFHIWISEASTGKPTEAQMHKIEAVDWQLRARYDVFMNERPVISDARHETDK